ncbi:MAG TPA: methyltransferase domain-containing protein [Gaiellaceae bacterium]|nr:methyltransferase domain-containing protein [Gaiellaceae bacterium]
MKRFAFVKTAAGEGYDAEFMDAMASEYDEKTPWTVMRLENVRFLVDPQPGDRVLDLGSAAGAMTHYLSTFGCIAVGVDSSQLGVEYARARYPNLRFEVADVAALPFEDASFDKIVAADLTEHLDDETLGAMLRECRRVLVSGGTLSIHTPNPGHIIERMKRRNLVLAQNPTHIGLRSSAELRAELEHAGFVIEVDVKRPGFFPVLRTFERLARGRIDVLGYRICIRGRASA